MAVGQKTRGTAAFFPQDNCGEIKCGRQFLLGHFLKENYLFKSTRQTTIGVHVKCKTWLGRGFET
jgi:hypothetical protein